MQRFPNRFLRELRIEGVRIAGTLLVLALLAASPLAAGPEIPLAPAALAPVGGVHDAHIASNGAMMLAAWIDSRAEIFTYGSETVFAARIDAAGQTLDPLGIPIAYNAAQSSAVRVAAFGSGFLVAYSVTDDLTYNLHSIWIATVDANGVVTGNRRVGFGIVWDLATNDTTAMLITAPYFGNLYGWHDAVALDRDLHVVRTTHFLPTGQPRIVATTDEFVALFSPQSERTSLFGWFFDAAGNPLGSPFPVFTAAGGAPVTTFAPATDGPYVYVAVTAGDQSTIAHIGFPALPLPAKVLVQSLAVTAEGLQVGVQAGPASSLRFIGRNGVLTKELSFDGFWPPEVVSVGKTTYELLLTRDTQQLAGALEGDAPSTFVRMPRNQRPPAVASDGASLFVVWTEGRDVVGVRTSLGGQPLAPPITIASDRPGLGFTAAVWAGDAWVVAWYENDVLTARRLSRDGAVDAAGSILGTTTFSADFRPPRLASDGHSVVAAYASGATWFPTSALAGGVELLRNATAVDVAWNGAAYIVLTSQASLNSYVVTPAGAIAARRDLGHGDTTEISLACNAERCFATFANPWSRALLLDRDGKLITDNIVLASGSVAGVAWDGRNFLAGFNSSGPRPFDALGARIAPDGRVLETFPVSATALNDDSATPTPSGVFVYRRQVAQSGVHQIFVRFPDPTRPRTVQH